MNAAISCHGLKKHYGDVRAVDGLDLEVRAGECFGMLGPNGAGKTTTIEILEGLTPPDAGEVTILGRRWGSDERELRERLGISLQETRLTEKLTVFETLSLFRSFYVRGRDPEQLMADLSLEEKRDARVGKLSGGQRQRLAVACALAGDPEILFLDEPTTGLDPQSRLQLWERIAAYKAAGPHGPSDDALHGGGRAALRPRRRRRPRKDHRPGLPRRPHRRPARAAHHRVLDGARGLGRHARGIPGVGERRQRDGQWFLAAASLAQAVPALLAALDDAGAKLVSLSTHQATLEDVFISLTGRELRNE